MAVAGVLVMMDGSQVEAVLSGLKALPGVSLFGHEQGNQVAAVLEAPSGEMETRLEVMEALPGVLRAFITYVNTEDESGAAPA